MKKLIVNADDFGLHHEVNLGIIEGHSNGCITSTSIMPTGKAFQQAVELASEFPQLGIGVHLTLVGEKPICKPKEVASLIGSNGNFLPQYPSFLLRFLRGEAKLIEIRRELTAQVEKVLESGIKVTHLDSHQHLHIFPKIIDIVLDIAQQFNIKAIRIPDEQYFFTGGYPYTFARVFGRSGLTALSRLARKKAANQGIQTPQAFFGMLAGGNMSDGMLLNILKQLPQGVSEVMIHPGCNDRCLNELFGWQYHWQAELAAVTSNTVAQYIAQAQIQLVSFGEVIDG